MGVYKKVPYARTIGRTGRRPIGIKWVDVKKAAGRHRSRLVAKEVNNGIDLAVYAATPPLEASKLLTVKRAARGRERRGAAIAPGDDNRSIMIHVDVHRAHLYAHAKRNTYVEVPDEGGQVCGSLVKAMYGTRQAASRRVFFIEVTWTGRDSFTVTTS